MKSAAKFVVKGSVQGVFYRKFCEENANSLSLTGYVRNLESGDVEVFVEGEKKDIDQMEIILKKGPVHSQIRSVLREDKKWDGNFKEFKVLRF
jgi:acylphosphatase